MPKFIVHIGLTKTGSTYLQGSLWAMSRQLREAGIWYPKPNGINHVSLLKVLTRAAEDQLTSIFGELNASPLPVVVLSCEGFSGLGRKHLVHLRQLMGEAECEIVLYCRRWSDWLPSHWQQSVKAGGSTDTFPEAAMRVLSDPSAKPINFGAILDQFGEVFGHAALRLISYSNLMDAKIELLRHFCQTVLSLNEIVPPLPSGKYNESTGVYLTELIRCINSLQSGAPTRAGILTMRTLLRHKDNPELQPDLDTVFKAMEGSAATFRLDDDCPAFRPLFEQISEKYRASLVSPEFGREIFEKKAKDVQYVRPDYLLRPEIMETIHRIDASIGRLAAASPKRPTFRLVKSA